MFSFNNYGFIPTSQNAANAQISNSLLTRVKSALNNSTISIQTAGTQLPQQTSPGSKPTPTTPTQINQMPSTQLIHPGHPDQMSTGQPTPTQLQTIGLRNPLASAVLYRSMMSTSDPNLAARFLPFCMTNPSTGASFSDYTTAAAASGLGLFGSYTLLHEEPKPNHSYIGLIAMAILNSVDKKLVLSDIYQYILDNYPYFRTRGPGWRNSIRHNLSLNDCFIKAGRSANGKGHFWAIHPACRDDFAKGDFRRRHAQRKVRKAMGLAVGDDESDTPRSPSPVASTKDEPFHHDSSSNSSPIKSFSSPLGTPVSSRTPPRMTFKRELPCDDVTDLESHLSDLSPLKPLVQSGHGSMCNEESTPPSKKRQKRCFNIESLLLPDSQTEEHSANDEHEQETNADTFWRSLGRGVESYEVKNLEKFGTIFNKNLANERI